MSSLPMTPGKVRIILILQTKISTTGQGLTDPLNKYPTKLL